MQAVLGVMEEIELAVSEQVGEPKSEMLEGVKVISIAVDPTVYVTPVVDKRGSVNVVRGEHA